MPTMPALSFGAQTLAPIANTTVEDVNLRRRSSAPELAKIAGRSSGDGSHFAVGNILRLQLLRHPESRDSYTVVSAEIVRLFLPLSMAAVMVVRIHEPALSLKGDFVLKVFDRIRAEGWRASWTGSKQPWTMDRDISFEKHRWHKGIADYFQKLVDSDCLFSDLEDEEKQALNVDYEILEQAKVYAEWRLHYTCVKMYSAEIEMYRRAREHKLDGCDTPRFISSVQLPRAYTSKACADDASAAISTAGVLMEYIPGFPLSDLYNSPSPRVPRSSWTPLIDEAVQVINKISQICEVRNHDCYPRNTVVHWDPIGGKWKVKFIDFGHCDFKPEGISDRDWRGLQSYTDEEVRIGRFMMIELERTKDFKYVWELSDYWMQVYREHRMD